MNEKIKPIKSFKKFPIEIAVWQNEKSRSITIDKSYKVGKEFKKTKVLNERDLTKVAFLLQEARQFLVLGE
jgi:hypothetical protein